jgi:ABC-type nitrate/sulfonate/bicarbonate transport system permease component
MRLPDRVVTALIGIVVPATVMVVYEIVAKAGLVNAVFLPAPSAILAAFLEIVRSGALLPPLLHTLALLLLGYGIGCLLAVLLGTLMGYSRAVFNLFEPLVELLRPIPKPALLPPLVLFLGLGPKSEVTLVALGCFFPVLINTLQGVRSIDPTLIDAARTFGHSTNAIWRQILLPASAPSISAGMRISLGLGLILVVISEMLSGTGGLGDAILSAQRSFLIKESYAWLLVLAIMGLILATIFNAAERKIVFWNSVQAQ